jgi:hypothetical protein
LDWSKFTKSNPCPICSKTQCTFSPDGCIVFCRRVELGAFKEGNGGYLHKIKDHQPSGNIPPVTRKPRKQKSGAETLDAVYRAFLYELVLSPEHLAQLKSNKRQMSDAQITRRMYRTLPGTGRAKVCRILSQQFTQSELLSVPGFYISNKGRYGEYLTFAGTEGLLCPFRDKEDRIVGLQIRPDDSSGSKYTWFSCGQNHKEGVGIGGEKGLPAHVSIPFEQRDSRVFVTEGPIKADIASDILGAVVIAVPGIHSWKACRLLETVRDLEANEVVIAYDSEDNEPTRREERKVATALQIAGNTVYLAKWNGEKGKGIDDLLLGGGRPTFDRWEYRSSGDAKRRTGRKRVIEIPAVAVSKTKDVEPFSIDHIRGVNYREFESVLANPKPSVTILGSSTGTGKTTAVFNALKAKRDDGWLGLRVIFAVDTRQQIEEILSDHPWVKENSTVLVGRNKENCIPEMLHTINKFGTARQNVSRNICSECPMRDYPCVYFDDHKKARSASLVIATKSAIFNNPNLLKGFDVVIVDEEIIPSLLELNLSIKLDDILIWLSRMNALNEDDENLYADSNPYKVLSGLLQDVVLKGSGNLEEWEWQSLMSLLKKNNDIELSSVLAKCTLDDQLFEKPFSDKDGKRVVPLRLMKDLIREMKGEIDRPEGADTRLWLTPEGIKVCLVKTEIVEVLRRRALINLDATPSPILDTIFPNAKPISMKAYTEIEITQIKDRLLTSRSLERPETFALVNTTIERLTKNAAFPVIFSHKAYNPNAGDGGWSLSNQAASFGHFGLDHRATNRPEFMKADVFVIVGHYAHPPSAIRAQVQAIRHSQDGNEIGSMRFPMAYEYTEAGKGWAREVPVDSDPLTQRIIEHQIRADIIQTIGRARASLRYGEAPLQVYILSAYPLAGVKPKRLCDLKDLSGISDARTPPQQANIKRSEDATARILEAVNLLERSGKPVTESAIRKESGVRRDAVKRFFMDGGYGGNHINTESCSSDVPPAHIEADELNETIIDDPSSFAEILAGIEVMRRNGESSIGVFDALLSQSLPTERKSHQETESSL